MYYKAIFTTLVTLSIASQGFGAIVFSENIGTPTGTTPIATHTFQNSGTLTFSGTADVRSTSASTGYTGSSGGGNVFLTNTIGTNFTIAGIDTSNYVAGSMTLSFGAFKSTTASNLTELQVSYSTGGAFTNLSFVAQPTGGGTANWRNIVITNANLIPVSSSLQLRWTNTSTVPQFRIDDILLQGTLVSVPEPSSLALVSVVGCNIMVLYLRRKRSKLDAL